MPRNYCRERLADPKKFYKGSYRTKRTGQHLVVLACPKAATWTGTECRSAKGKARRNPKTGRPVGTFKAQSILHPAAEKVCKCLFVQEAAYKRTGRKSTKPCPGTRAGKAAGLGGLEGTGGSR